MKMENYHVKDIKLAKQGLKRIEWAEFQMPVLMKIRERFKKTKPLKGQTIGMALHVTKETAVLVRTLIAGGAKVAITGCNPLSTQDDVAAALAKEGVHVFAWRGENNKEYYAQLNKVLDFKPTITIDDGCDLVTIMHTKRQECLTGLLGAAEETTTGVIRLNAMEKEGVLACPAMNVNDADTKHLFDNYLGTAQSTLDAILRNTNILLAGKTIVIAGFGFCGKGMASRSKGNGMNVIITEVDPVKALQAMMEGYSVMPMREAAKLGDVFVTVTGDINVLTKNHFKLMKDKAILANSGHFDVEINVPDLTKAANKRREINENLFEYTLPGGKRLLLLAEGRLANLAAAEGHPSEVMSLSFANQALAIEYFIKNKGKLENKVYDVPFEVDQMIARIMLETRGLKIDKLTPEQKKYLSSWNVGT